MRTRIMRPLRGLLGVAVVATSLSPVAMAADINRPPRTPDNYNTGYAVGRYDWNGFYGGAQVGYEWGSADSTAQWGNLLNTPEEFDYGTKGAVGGLHLGYNVTAGSALFGWETDLELAELTGAGHGTGNAIHTTEIDWAGSFRGRIGFVISGDKLLYLTGGIAYANINTEQREKLALTYFSKDQQVKTGWTLGGGIEQALGPAFTVRLEYRYTDFGSVS